MSTDPHELVRNQALVRVHSGALGLEDQVMAEGTVVAYSPNPMICVQLDDGRRDWWPVTLPMTELDGPESGTRCPRCGSSRPVGRRGVCGPCAEAEG